MYNQITSNKRKTVFLMFLALGLIMAIGWFLSWQFDNPAILFWAVIISLFQAIGSYYYSDKIALAVSGALPAKRADYLELHRLVENLAIVSGLPKPKVYVITDTSLNALATGRDPQRAAVAVTTGLLEKLNRTELEGVLAHEMSHIKNYDIRLMTIVVVLIGIISLVSDFALRGWLFGGGRRREGGNQIIALLGFALILLSPIFAWLIQLAISRKREYLADANGALLTRYPEGLARALEKISHDPHVLQKANSATAHLFIANPFKKQSFLQWFSTHPPALDRIKKLRQMGA